MPDESRSPPVMTRARLEAFSDGVLAIAITIMVLELRVPHSSDWSALRELVPTFASHVLSFMYLAIYWTNHHHMFQLVDRVDGRILWANLHLLFWLSLVPFTTGWMDETSFATHPVAIYGVVLMMSAIAYYVLSRTIIHSERAKRASLLEAAIGRDWKGIASIVLYAAAILLAFVNRWVGVAMYWLVAALWLVPDRRIESPARVRRFESLRLSPRRQR
jgi:uncharacterized membrane protein